MSQHDMIVDNGTGGTVRADFNAALQALASTSKGNGRPSTAYAGQLWIDDNTPSSTVWTLNFYDGSGDIALGTIDTSSDTFTPSAAAGGLIGIRRIASGSGTYSETAGTNSILVKGQAGGASGSRGTGGSPNCGGGAGGYFEKRYTSGFSGASYSVGTGGAAVTSDGTGGNSGGNTTFASCTATGGAGGDVTNNGRVAGGGATGGDVNITGGDGYVLVGSAAALTAGGAAPVRGSSAVKVGVGAGISGRNPGDGGTGSTSGNNSGAGSDGYLEIWEYS
jgi:hypothetical protein